MRKLRPRIRRWRRSADVWTIQLVRSPSGSTARAEPTTQANPSSSGVDGFSPLRARSLRASPPGRRPKTSCHTQFIITGASFQRDNFRGAIPANSQVRGGAGQGRGRETVTPMRGLRGGRHGPEVPRLNLRPHLGAGSRARGSSPASLAPASIGGGGQGRVDS